MIFKQIKEKPFEYLALVVLLGLSFFGFIFFESDPHAQRRVVYVGIFSYLAWSLFHHYRRGDLQLSIIVEYLIIALFAIVVLFTTVL